MSLDPEVKTQWVEALRSGKFKQGYEQLRRIDTDDDGDVIQTCYCCLGVLAEIRPELKFNGYGCAVYEDGDDGCRDIGHLPPRYVHDIGLDESNQSTLICMNDGYDEDKCMQIKENAKTFVEIADFIEASL